MGGWHVKRTFNLGSKIYKIQFFLIQKKLNVFFIGFSFFIFIGFSFFYFYWGFLFFFFFVFILLKGIYVRGREFKIGDGDSKVMKQLAHLSKSLGTGSLYGQAWTAGGSWLPRHTRWASPKFQCRAAAAPLIASATKSGELLDDPKLSVLAASPHFLRLGRLGLIGGGACGPCLSRMNGPVLCISSTATGISDATGTCSVLFVLWGRVVTSARRSADWRSGWRIW